MNKINLSLLVMTVVFAAILIGGCETANNTNRNANVNANVNTANRNGNSNASQPERGSSREEFEKTKDRIAQQAKELGRKIGSGADDLWIWTKTRTALAAAEDLRDTTISVDVDNDVVTLTGTVPTDAQKAKAEQVARSIEGVKGVKNELKLTNTNKNAR
jgi:hypothetical protein